MRCSALQVAISTMKASRFSLAFADRLNYWEKALSMISECVELIMGVQRQWMYLENIFAGSGPPRPPLCI